MPELPEVETVRRELEPWLVGRSIVGVSHHPSAKFTPACDAVGTTIETVARRGKYLLFDLDDGHEMVVHLGMTGRLSPATPPAGDDPHVRARWDLDDGTILEFNDIRRFGRIAVVPRGHYETLPTLDALGPEPFDPAFEPAAFAQALEASHRTIKTQLLSQRPVAGVGNIYADEALWEAEINPAARRVLGRPSDSTPPGDPSGPATWPGQSRHHIARLPNSLRSRGPESAHTSVLRTSRRAVRAVRDAAAAEDDRCPLHHLVPGVPGPLIAVEQSPRA